MAAIPPCGPVEVATEYTVGAKSSSLSVAIIPSLAAQLATASSNVRREVPIKYSVGPTIKEFRVAHEGPKYWSLVQEHVSVAVQVP